MYLLFVRYPVAIAVAPAAESVISLSAEQVIDKPIVLNSLKGEIESCNIEAPT